MARNWGNSGTSPIAYAHLPSWVGTLDSAKKISISMWITVSGYATASDGIYILKADTLEGATTSGSFAVISNGTSSTAGTLRFLPMGWTGGGLFTIPGPTASAAWHHLAITYDGNSTANKPIIILDGTTQTVTTATIPSGTNTFADTAPIYIGSDNTGNFAPNTCSIADVAVWPNTILTTQEMQSIWRQGLRANQIRAERLGFYVPLLGDPSLETDYVSNTGGLTNYNAGGASTRVSDPARLTAFFGNKQRLTTRSAVNTPTTLSVSAASTPSIKKNIFKLLSVSTATSPALTKRIGKFLKVSTTWNALDKDPTVTLSSDGLTDTHTVGDSIIRGTTSKIGGKWVYAYTVTTGATSPGTVVGFANATQSLATYVGTAGNNSFGVFDNGTAANFIINDINGMSVGRIFNGDTVLIAIDDDAKLSWCYSSGQWTGDPALGTGGFNYSAMTGAVFPAVSSANGFTGTANFGDTAMPIPLPKGFSLWNGGVVVNRTTNVNKTLATTESSTVSLKKSFGKLLSFATSTSTSATKNIPKAMLVSEASTATETGIKAKPVNLSTTNTPSASLIRLIGKALSTSASSSPSATKGIAKAALAASGTSSAAVTKGLARTLLFSEATTSSLTKGTSKFLATTEGSAATRGAFQIGKLGALTEVTSPSVTKRTSTTKAVSEASSATTTKNTAKALSVNEGSTTLIIKVVGKLAAVSFTASASVIKGIAKTLPIDLQTTTPRLSLNTSKMFLYSEATSTVEHNSETMVAKTVNVVTAPNLTKNIHKVAFTTSEASAPSSIASRSNIRNLATTAPSTASLQKNILKLANVNEVTTASRNFHLSRTFAVTNVTEASSGKNLPYLFTTTAPSIGLLPQKGANRLLNLSASASSIAFGKKLITKLAATTAGTSASQGNSFIPSGAFLAWTFVQTAANSTRVVTLAGHFTVEDIIDIRRYCGYPVYGNYPITSSGYRYFQVFLSFESRIAQLTIDEMRQVRSQFLYYLRTLESDIPQASDNLDTIRAGIWTSNKYEVQKRVQLFLTWRRRLCKFLGITEGPGLEDFKYEELKKRRKI